MWVSLEKIKYLGVVTRKHAYVPDLDYTFARDDSTKIDILLQEEKNTINFLKPTETSDTLQDALEIISSHGITYPKLEAKHPDIDPDEIFKFGYIIIEIDKVPKFVQAKFVIEVSYLNKDTGFDEIQIRIKNDEDDYLLNLNVNSKISEIFLKEKQLQRSNGKFFELGKSVNTINKSNIFSNYEEITPENLNNIKIYTKLVKKAAQKVLEKK